MLSTDFDRMRELGISPGDVFSFKGTEVKVVGITPYGTIKVRRPADPCSEYLTFTPAELLGGGDWAKVEARGR
jgi:hypothetical protein